MAGIPAPHPSVDEEIDSSDDEIYSFGDEIDILPEWTEMTSTITEKDQKSHDSKSYGQCKTVTEKNLETGLIGEHSAAEKT